jgi:hypothetical protein
MPLCVKSMFWPGLERGELAPCLETGLVVVLWSGPGSDLSEEPVYQGVSRPRWIKSRPWVSSRTRQSFQLMVRWASAMSRR